MQFILQSTRFHLILARISPAIYLVTTALSAIGLMVISLAWADDVPDPRVVSELLTQFRTLSTPQRIQAAGRLISLRAKGAAVVSAFADTVRDSKADEVLRGFAANGLRVIGSEAAPARPT
jgi:hypothetical protein